MRPLPLLALLLCAGLPGLDVAAVRNGAVDIADVQRRYAAGEHACALDLACAHAFGAGVPLNELTCDALLEGLGGRLKDGDALLGDGGSDASGFIDYARSRLLLHGRALTPESLRWLRSAADKGFAPALHRLALYQNLGDTDQSVNGAATRARLEAAARAGSLLALRDLRRDFLHDLSKADRIAAQQRCAAQAEPMLVRALSPTDHESNLAIAEVATAFDLHELCQRIRLAAVASGLSETRCKLDESRRALAQVAREAKAEAEAAASPPLTPALQDDERAMLAMPVADCWSGELARFDAQCLLDLSHRLDRRGQWGERIDGLIELCARDQGGVLACPNGYWLRKRFLALIGAGCEDPVIWYLAYSRFGSGGGPRSDELLVAFYDALVVHEASFHLRVECAEQLCDRAFAQKGPEGEERRTGALQHYIADAVQGLRGPMRCRAQRSLHARALSLTHRRYNEHDWHLRCFAALKDAIVADAETAAIDPWLRDMVAGAIAYSEGWKVRGRGDSDGVTAEQWKGFGEHLGRARTLLERAYAVDPSLPDAAVVRVAVAMSEGEGMATVMTWLDHAIAAAPEDERAYQAAMLAANMGWGGMPVEIVAIGRRGSATGAWHTTAPLRLFDAIAVADRVPASERPAGPDRFTKYAEQLWPEMRAVLQTYIERAEDPGLRRWHQTALAAYAYKHGHAAEVQDLLQGELHGQILVWLAESIVADPYVSDQLLVVAGQD